jgi:thiol-disulfide isomerase/thioredoxin
MKILLQLFISVAYILFINAAAVPYRLPNPFEQYVSNKSSDKQGLYSDAEHVISLSADSMKPKVFQQNYASYVEFYNSYCGFCRR